MARWFTDAALRRRRRHDTCRGHSCQRRLTRQPGRFSSLPGKQRGDSCRRFAAEGLGFLRTVVFCVFDTARKREKFLVRDGGKMTPEHRDRAFAASSKCRAAALFARNFGRMPGFGADTVRSPSDLAVTGLKSKNAPDRFSDRAAECWILAAREARPLGLSIRFPGVPQASISLGIPLDSCNSGARQGCEMPCVRGDPRNSCICCNSGRVHHESMT